MTSRRFLMPGGGQGHEAIGYASKPLREIHDDPQEVKERVGEALTLRDEPECPSKAWVDAQSELAARYERQRCLAAHRDAVEARQGIPVQKRIEDAQRRARRKRLNFDLEISIINGLITRGKAAGVQRLERLEALLDGVLESAA